MLEETTHEVTETVPHIDVTKPEPASSIP